MESRKKERKREETKKIGGGDVVLCLSVPFSLTSRARLLWRLILVFRFFRFLSVLLVLSLLLSCDLSTLHMRAYHMQTLRLGSLFLFFL